MRIHPKLMMNAIVLSILTLYTPLLFGQYASGTGTPDDPFLIETAEQINAIGQHQEHWDKHFKQIAHIDLSVYTGEQFNMIGIDGNGQPTPVFLGVFDGNGYEIRNFTYRSAKRGIALFQAVSWPGELKNITMVNPMVKAPTSNGVAALVFMLTQGTISNCKVLGGTISGGYAVGGLVSTYWTVASDPGSDDTKIINCHVTADVSGSGDHTGGLVGMSFGRVYMCSTAGSVMGKSTAGGLVSWNGNFSQWDTLLGDIRDCYSTCRVTGTSDIGGLVGLADRQTTITRCYAAGPVTGQRRVGALIGRNNGSVIHSFWDAEISELSRGSGGTGLSTLEMQNPDTFLSAGWDAITTWILCKSLYPKLHWELTSLLGQASNVYQTEDANIGGAAIENDYSGYLGTGYVNFIPDGNGFVEWIVPEYAGVKTLRLRYANGTAQDAYLQATINGEVGPESLCFSSTGAWDTWDVLQIETTLNQGDNVIRLAPLPSGTAPHLDSLEIIGNNTNLAAGKALICSDDANDYPVTNVVDANIYTLWTAQGFPQWFEVNLGEVYPINQSRLGCRDNRAYQYKVEGKASAQDTYTLLLDRTDNTWTPSFPWAPMVDNLDTTAAVQYVKLTITGAHAYDGNEVGIYEWGLFSILEEEVDVNDSP